MMLIIRDCAIQIAKRYSITKRETQRRFRQDIDSRLRDKIERALRSSVWSGGVNMGWDYTSSLRGRNVWDIFYEVDEGRLSVLENAYDSLREEFKKRFHEDYDPLEGRRGSVCGGAHLDLRVEGIDYDEPEAKRKHSELWYELMFLLAVLLFYGGSVILYEWLGHWGYSFLISFIVAFVFGWVTLREFFTDP